MKILMITPYLPYPPESGGQTRSYHLIKRLSKHHKISLFCYYRQEEEKNYLAYLQPYVKKIIMVKRRKAFHLLHILLGLFTHLPFLLISTYLSIGMQQSIKKELENEDYDLIHCETFYVSPNVPKTDIPLVLVEQTVEYYVYRHFIDKFPVPLAKWLFHIELAKLLHWEKRTWQRAARILTVSQDDADTIKRLDFRQQDKLAVVPNGTDVAAFRQCHTKPNLHKPTFCYVGNFKWLQNKEALQYLLHHIYPQLQKDFSSFKLIVAGKHIPNELMIKKNNILFMESIKDIRTVYKQADILIAPIFGPGGTRLKILEAMASKVLVVTTPIGAKGLDVADGREIVTFTSIPTLNKKLKIVLSNKEAFNKIINQAYQKVLHEYDWNAIVKKLEKNYAQVSDGRKK